VAILDSTITNADVANNAAIALSKIASGTAAQVVIANSSGTPTYTTISGDVTINSSGVVQIEPGKIVDADINASAAIDKTKISGTAITAGDTGTVTSTMIADGTIVNGDINASAAIAASKISGTAITAADTGTVTSTMIADGTIVNADINASAAIALGKLADATIDIKTGNYTLQLTDKNKFIKMNITSTANTVTVPLDSTVTFPEGAQIHIIQYGTGKTQIVGASGSVILYSTPGAYLRAQYSSATLLKCAAANTWMLMGDLSAS
jgi:sporulation protein YlmC with PRC-barrel domain